ncbi:hypothetical protein AB0N36_33415 [Streptomyces acidicola]
MSLGNVVGVAEQDESAPPQEHRTTTVDQGRICVARCTCGWRGPARRARSFSGTLCVPVGFRLFGRGVAVCGRHRGVRTSG